MEVALRGKILHYICEHVQLILIQPFLHNKHHVKAGAFAVSL